MNHDASIYGLGLSDEAHRASQNAELSVDIGRQRIHRGAATDISMEAAEECAGYDDHGSGYGRFGSRVTIAILALGALPSRYPVRLLEVDISRVATNITLA